MMKMFIFALCCETRFLIIPANIITYDADKVLIF